MTIRLRYITTVFLTFWMLPAYGNIQIDWESPEELRDFETSFMADEFERADLMEVFEQFAAKASAAAFPAGTQVSIVIKQIDMAGRFEWWRGFEYEDVRIVNGSQFAYLELSYVITDAEGVERLSGDFKKRHSQMLPANLRDRDQQFPYIRELFRDFLRETSKNLAKVSE